MVLFHCHVTMFPTPVPVSFHWLPTFAVAGYMRNNSVWSCAEGYVGIPIEAPAGKDCPTWVLAGWSTVCLYPRIFCFRWYLRGLQTTSIVDYIPGSHKKNDEEMKLETIIPTTIPRFFGIRVLMLWFKVLNLQFPKNVSIKFLVFVDVSVVFFRSWQEDPDQPHSSIVF